MEHKTPEQLKYLYTRNKERIDCVCGKKPFKNDIYSHKKTLFHTRFIESQPININDCSIV